MNIIVKSIYVVLITALIVLTPGCASEPGDDSEGAAEIDVETVYLETVEQSLEKAGLDDLAPLNEHLDRFREKQGKVSRELDLDYDKFGLAPRINLINYIEVDGELVELTEPLTLDEELFGKGREEITLLYHGEEITTVGRVLEAWHEHLDNELKEEVRRQEADYRGDAFRDGQLFFKHDRHENIISFQLSWGSIVSQALGYLDLETGEVGITDFFPGGQVSQTSHKWSPCGRYHAYQVSSAGEGERELRLTSLEDLSSLEIEQPEKLLGEFEDLSWSEDGSCIYFDVKEELENEEVITSWVIDTEEMEMEPFAEALNDMLDEKLQAAVRAELDKPVDELTEEDLLEISTLDLAGKGITDLTGLEYAKNLEALYIERNEIEDIAILKELPNLRTLSACQKTIKPEDQIKLAANLSLKELNIKGMEKFCGNEDLTIQGAKFKGIDSLYELMGEPVEKITNEEVPRDAIGAVAEKVYKYEGLELTYIQFLKREADGWKKDEDADYSFDRIEVNEPGIEGPRGIAVGDSIEEISSIFPVIYSGDRFDSTFIRMPEDKIKTISFNSTSALSDANSEAIVFRINFEDDVVKNYEIFALWVHC